MEYLFKSVNMYNQYIKYKIPLSSLSSLSSEIYLIKWLPNSKTIIHNHNGKQCSFISLNSLHESIYSTSNQHDISNSRKIKPFHIYTINDNIGYHRIFNYDDKIKWSLHRYY